MSHKNDSSQMKECLTHPSTADESKRADKKGADVKGADSKGADSKGAGSKGAALKGADVKGADSKGAGSKGADSKGADSKGGDPKGGDPKGADVKRADSNAMGSKMGRTASNGSVSNDVGLNRTDSNRANSSGASLSGTSSKRKHSQSSNVDATNLGSPPKTWEDFLKLKREPDCHMELEELYHSANHTVLIDTKRFRDNLLTPFIGQHVWDHNHVKLPPQYPKNEHGCRWKATEKALERLTRGNASVKDVEMAILSYNQAYKKEWAFNALNTYFQQLNKHENNFSTVISKMATLAQRLPDYIKHPIPLLKQNRSHAITLSQVQISCLLANAFFCTFPHRNSTKPNSEYSSFPTINFSNLFGDTSQRKTQKLRALFHYFNTVTDKGSIPDGLVTFKRICVPPNELPNWITRKETLTTLHVSSHGLIERQGKGMLQVDFASKYIGGGVLGKGLVQEEIRFLLSPELIVARLFTEKLGDNECLKITGAQTYSTSTGYSDNFEWQGPYLDDTKRDKWKRRFCQIVAIDALKFNNPRDQYTEHNVKRELNKAYVGFKSDPSIPLEYTPAIATGNWGCGAFKGDPQLKALIQLMAAAVAKRDMAFFTFEEQSQAQELQEMHDILKTKNVSVGDLYKLLKKYCVEDHHKSKQVFEYIREKTGSPSSNL